MDDYEYSVRRAWAEQSEYDSNQARAYAEAAVEPRNPLNREIGTDRLIALAQVYATLSTRK